MLLNAIEHGGYFDPEQYVEIDYVRARHMLSAATDVPEQALKVVDAFVLKSCLASRLLPAIELLCGSESLPPYSYDA